MRARRSISKFALLCGALCFDAAAYAQETSESVIEQVLQEANTRAQAGASAAAVDQFVSQKLEAAGIQVEPEPPAWDVYGRARWRREMSASPMQTAIDTSALPPSGVSEPPASEGIGNGRHPGGPETRVPHAEPATGGSGDVVRGGISRAAATSRRAAVVHFQDAGGLDVEGLADMETGVLHADSTQ
jgi:hypothetical protein